MRTICSTMLCGSNSVGLYLDGGCQTADRRCCGCRPEYLAGMANRQLFTFRELPRGEEFAFLKHHLRRARRDLRFEAREEFGDVIAKTGNFILDRLAFCY